MCCNIVNIKTEVGKVTVKCKGAEVLGDEALSDKSLYEK